MAPPGASATEECSTVHLIFLFLTFVSCLLTVTLHIVDVRLTCLINITYLLTYLLTVGRCAPATAITDFPLFQWANNDSNDVVYTTLNCTL